MPTRREDDETVQMMMAGLPYLLALLYVGACGAWVLGPELKDAVAPGAEPAEVADAGACNFGFGVRAA